MLKIKDKTGKVIGELNDDDSAPIFKDVPEEEECECDEECDGKEEECKCRCNTTQTTKDV